MRLCVGCSLVGGCCRRWGRVSLDCIAWAADFGIMRG